MNIDSQLHNAIDMMKRGRARRADGARSGLLNVVTVEVSQADLDVDLAVLEAALTAPRFVFNQDVIDMTETDECTLSGLDMVRADVFHLPFPRCVVELAGLKDSVGYNVRSICVLAELGHGEFLSIPWLTFGGPDGFVACSGMSITSKLTGSTAEDAVWRNDIAVRWPTDTGTQLQFVGAANLSLTCAVIMLQTLGLRREVVDVGPRLNRKRAASGRSAITPYTRISIGRVYRRDDGDEHDEYVPGKSPRPHWRRGHTRRYHYGPGRADGTRVRWIPARMVALAAAPEYRVSK